MIKFPSDYFLSYNHFDIRFNVSPSINGNDILFEKPSNELPCSCKPFISLTYFGYRVHVLIFGITMDLTPSRIVQDLQFCLFSKDSDIIAMTAWHVLILNFCSGAICFIIAEGQGYSLEDVTMGSMRGDKLPVFRVT